MDQEFPKLYLAPFSLLYLYLHSYRVQQEGIRAHRQYVAWKSAQLNIQFHLLLSFCPPGRKRIAFLPVSTPLFLTSSWDLDCVPSVFTFLPGICLRHLGFSCHASQKSSSLCLSPKSKTTSMYFLSVTTAPRLCYPSQCLVATVINY